MPKLTQSFVKSVVARPGEVQTFYMDDELTGFGLRVSPTKKVFYLQMRVGRKVLKRRIGEYGPMTVDQGKRVTEALWKSNHCMSTIADRARRRTVCT